MKIPAKNSKAAKRPRVLKIISACLASFFIAAVLFCWLITEPAIKIHGFRQLSTQKINQIHNSLSFYDDEGLPVGGDFITDNKIYVPFSSLQNHTVDAFVSIEDTRFFSHGGVDYYRIAGAAVKNIKSRSFKEGASTITQQLVKNTHLSGEKKIKRKINEMRIATELERRYSKSEILEMYLNAIYFGNNICGIGAAAKVYFNKPAEKLTVNESALLAAIINNPTKFNPVTSPKDANKRRRLVLGQMRRLGRLTQAEYQQNEPVDILIEGIFFDQYANFLVSEACEVLNLSKNEFFRRGYKITTCLDSKLQAKINRLLQNFTGKNGLSLINKGNALLNVVVMRSNGDIIANAGHGAADLSGIYRQPGSMIKPAISYAPALEKRLISPITPILDSPIRFGSYTPQNYKNKNLGWISVCDSLKYSQNIPAIKLMDMCGIEYSKNIAMRLGFSFEKSDNHLALALGGMKKGAKLTQIAGSYQAFANSGQFIKGAHITSIHDRQGNVVYKRERIARQAVSAETAYFINEMLSQCAVDGTAKRIGKGYAAKTGTVGTAEGNSDAYVVAYNSEFVIAVWIGAKNKPLSNSVGGGTYPCVIAKEILKLLPSGGEFVKPDSIINVDIDKDEYYKNHRLVVASQSISKKNRISANFSVHNLPQQRVLDNNFILNMNDIDFENFRIIDKEL